MWAIGKMATQHHFIRIEWANVQVYVFCDAPIHNPPNFHIMLYMYSSLEEPNTTAAGWRYERLQTHPISHPWRKPCISIWFKFFFFFSRRDPQEVLQTLLSRGRCKLSRSLLQSQRVSIFLSISTSCCCYWAVANSWRLFTLCLLAAKVAFCFTRAAKASHGSSGGISWLCKWWGESSKL